MRDDQASKIIASILAKPGGSGDTNCARAEDWPYVIESATEDGLGGLILEALDVSDSNVPPFARRALQAGARSVGDRNERMMSQLESVIAALNDAEIPVLLLKGAALRVSAYPSLDLRPMSDVDLLVQERDAVRAVDILKQAGCREGLPLVRSDFFPRFYYETELLTSDAQPLRIDLHARPLRPLRYARLVDEESFWQAATLVHIGRAKAFILSPEMMLIHLAAHAAFHGCARLIWLYDLKRWVDAYGSSINWARFEERCAIWKLTLPVRQAIARAESLFDPFIPEPVRKRLESHRASWRDHLALKQAPRDAGSPWLHVLADILCTPGWRFRMGYLFALSTPDRGHLADIYPFRHRGWPAVASVYRMVRAAMRLVGGMARRTPLISVLFNGNDSAPNVSWQQRDRCNDSVQGTRAQADQSIAICPGM